MGARGLVHLSGGRGGDLRRGGVCLDPLAGGGGREDKGTKLVEKGNERAGITDKCCMH